MPLEKLGEHLDSTLYACDLAEVEAELPELRFHTQYFLCLIGGDFSSIPSGDLVRLVSNLIAKGACYFICWGPGCESAHDLIDDILIGDDSLSSEETVIMTTWHADEPIEEALFALLCSAWPADKYLDRASTKLVVLINQPESFSLVTSALKNPHEFVERVTA